MSGAWHRVGIVGVDSARILVCDPAYAKPCAELDFASKDREGLTTQIDYAFPGNPMAIGVWCGHGDGAYRVMARTETCSDPECGSVGKHEVCTGLFLDFSRGDDYDG